MATGTMSINPTPVASTAATATPTMSINPKPVSSTPTMSINPTPVSSAPAPTTSASAGAKPVAKVVQQGTMSVTPTPVASTTPRTSQAIDYTTDGEPPLAQSVDTNFSLTGHTPTAQDAIYHDVVDPGSTRDANLGDDFTDYDSSTRQKFAAFERILNSPDFMQNYLAQDYASVATGPVDMSKYMPTVAGRTSFDYLREGINAQYAMEQERQNEQIDAMLAAQGITGPAAAAAKTQMIAAMNAQKAMQLQDVNRQEATYMQEAAMTEQAQRFSREERLGEQAFTGDLTYAQLNQNERQLVEEGRQYDNREDFDAWAEENKYTNEERQRAWQAIQNDANRSLDVQGLQQKVDSMRNDLAYQYEQLQTTTGVQRDQIRQNIFNNLQDIASAERQLKYRTYADQTLARLQSALEMGEYDYMENSKVRQSSYYNRGKAGDVISEEQLAALKIQDPLAYYSYLDGRAGLDQAMFDANMDLRSEYMATAIGSLADLTGNDFIAAMNEVYENVNTLFGPGGQFATSARSLIGGEDGNPPPPPPPPPNGASVDGSSPVSVDVGYVDTQSTVRTNGGMPINGVAQPVFYMATIGSGPDAVNVHADMVSYPTVPASTPGTSIMFRGTSAPNKNMVGGAYRSPTAVQYQATYPSTTPEAQAYVQDIARVGPYAAQNNQYLYDQDTLQAALARSITTLATQQPVQISNFSGAKPGEILTPQSALGFMMLAAGRSVSTPDGNVLTPVQGLPGGPDALAAEYGFPKPTPENMPLVDINYMKQLSDSGDFATLNSMAYTYANIGGYPYAIVPSYDPLTGQPRNGITAVSLHNPAVTIRWEV